jgi:trehalose synthase-fused probable maltokinase
MTDHAEVRATLQALLLNTGREAGWLTQQRWYADKGRAITSGEVMALRLEPVAEGMLALVVAQLRFADRGASQYFFPLYVTASGEAAGVPLGRIGDDSVLDAIAQPWFGDWLLRAFQEADPAWPSDLGPDGAALLDRGAQFPAEVLRGEQSNTSIRFGDTLIVKLFRRLQPGINPDEEALRVLSAQGFSHTPAFVGSLAWLGPEGVTYPLALATSFIPHQSDGWTWLLNRLEAVAADGDIDIGPERLLGQRTAEMHLALATARDGAFTPDASSASDIEQNQARTGIALERADEIIRERADALPSDTREALPAIYAALRSAEADVAGYDAELGLPRIRTHGDYHLGQTLRTDDDWVILDFEGEPARPVEERRQRASALKDVAGMLRSFAYARGASSLSLPEEGRAIAEPRLLAWESAARAAFLEAYRQSIADAGLVLVPESDDEFARALRAWELDKALYEVAYEARNRPTWLGIPLRALMTVQPYPETGMAGTSPAYP